MHVIRIVAAKCCAARQVDDDAPALLGEVMQRLAAEMAGGDEIDLQCAMPGGRPALEGILDIGGLINAGIVDQDVDPAAPGYRLAPDGRNRVILGEIADDRMAV